MASLVPRIWERVIRYLDVQAEVSATVRYFRAERLLACLAATLYSMPRPFHILCTEEQLTK